MHLASATRQPMGEALDVRRRRYRRLAGWERQAGHSMSGQRVDSPRHGLAVLRCRGIAIIEHRQALGKEAAASSINGTSLNPLRATKAPAAKGGQAHSRRRPPITRSPDHVGSAQSDRTRPGPVRARSNGRRARPRHPWAASPEESKAMTPSSRGSLRKMRRSWR